MEKEKSQQFTTVEAAKKLGIHPNTLKRWVKLGRLRNQNIHIARDYKGWFTFDEQVLEKIRQWKHSLNYDKEEGQDYRDFHPAGWQE